MKPLDHQINWPAKLANWHDQISRQFNFNGCSVPLNHDAESQISKRLEPPSNVHVFGSNKPETFAIDSLDVALHGQSSRQGDVTDNLSLTYGQLRYGA